MVDAIRSNHKSFMGFSRDHQVQRPRSVPDLKLSSENMLRHPHFTIEKRIGEFFYEDVAFDLYMATADIGSISMTPSDAFGVAVDSSQRAGILFKEVLRPEDENRVERKLDGLVGGDYMTIRDLERASGMSVEIVSKDRFRKEI